MRIIQLLLYLLVCCGAAECFTEKFIDLGQNVTLKCEVAVKDVNWFLMKASEPPVFILRSFSSFCLTAQCINTTVNKRFSLQYNNSLFIHNISTKELGVYRCIHTPTDSPPNISRGIRLYIQSHSAVIPGNQTTIREDEQMQNQMDKEPKVICFSQPLFVSVIMNCALALVVTVFTVVCCRRSPKTQTQPPGLHQQQDNINPVKSFTQVLKDDIFTVVEFTQFPLKA
ncbi:uncharacterized protein LOC132839052 isoform X1 [Tachysurus vachellii]|uniref:uncharacterized protein LOC132839052 isoform X1 n=1 Tax=Tachysurus vachellii TaxID=175792 RepID=UPI00296AC66E|nr:uncharacterized protein LOC132839052 isoform X1 [Tachysurus vachellii]XP_060715783.1 uncharacterized protein LOC132839052 isoform X1 [Tachysurus vachellii]